MQLLVSGNPTPYSYIATLLIQGLGGDTAIFGLSYLSLCDTTTYMIIGDVTTMYVNINLSCLTACIIMLYMISHWIIWSVCQYVV